jgi:hypothetical protein
MRLHLRNLVQATVATILLATTVAVAQAETWSLELKRLDSRNTSYGIFDRMDYIYRSTSPQHFFLQIMPDGKGGVRFIGNEQYAATFKKIVTKEPKYNSEQPFKGIAKLGTQEFAFALDASKPIPKKTDEKPKQDQDKATPKSETKSAVAKSKEKPAKPKSTPAIPTYDRLYFDFNHNGDLTDDKVVEGKVQTGSYSPGQSYASIDFPRLDVAIDVDGTPVESSFFFSGHMQSSSDFSYAQIQINAAAYREGEITLDGKKRRVVLIDFNSNGRFDDEMKILNINRPGGQEEIYPQDGDVLLIDPGQKQGTFDSPYDITSADYRHNVSKLVNLDSRFYDLKITPAGDKLTLDVSSVATGNVKNPNNGYSALIYNNNIILKISGNKDKPIPVPEGDWQLLSYTINLTEAPKPVEPAKKDDKKTEKEPSALKLLEDAIKAFTATPRISVPAARPRWSLISARGTRDYKAVQVVKGKTVELPFGPPYKPLVTTQNYGDPKQLNLQMSLVGIAGEICSNLYVNGAQPAKPKFTITDPKGEVVQTGSFEYG